MDYKTAKRLDAIAHRTSQGRTGDPVFDTACKTAGMVLTGLAILVRMELEDPECPYEWYDEYYTKLAEEDLED